MSTVQVVNLPELEAVSVLIACPKQDGAYGSGDD